MKINGINHNVQKSSKPDKNEATIKQRVMVPDEPIVTYDLADAWLRSKNIFR